MKKLLLLVFVCLFLFTSCNKVTDNPNTDDINNSEQNNVNDYFPIKENTRYSYEGKGNEFATYTVYIDYINQNRIQTRTNNGGTESIRVLELKDGQLTELLFRGETYFRENFTDGEYKNGKVLLKEPLEKGNSWSSGENSTSTITDIAKEITTPQGNIETIEVTTENEQGKTIEYYAKGKGLVKVIHTGEDYEVSSTLSNIETNVPLVQNITLYYPNVDGEHLNKIEVPVSFNTNDETKDIIEKNIKDLSEYNVFSTNTKINELYYNDKSNSVHIDLSKDFISEMNAGSSYEALILQSIANTLGNYYGVEKVYLTIDGKQYESGHITFKEDEYLTVDFSIVIE